MTPLFDFTRGTTLIVDPFFTPSSVTPFGMLVIWSVTVAPFWVQDSATPGFPPAFTTGAAHAVPEIRNSAAAVNIVRSNIVFSSSTGQNYRLVGPVFAFADLHPDSIAFLEIPT